MTGLWCREDRFHLLARLITGAKLLELLDEGLLLLSKLSARKNWISAAAHQLTFE